MNRTRDLFLRYYKDLAEAQRLDLRAHFAGMAMQGLLSRDIARSDERPRYEVDLPYDRCELAKHSILLAEILLAELEKEVAP